MNNNSPKSIWDTYTKSWSEPGQSKRLALFEQCLSPDCVYTDPLIQASGYQQFRVHVGTSEKRARTEIYNH